MNNLLLLREHILYHFVIEKRKAQLDSIKSGFKDDRLSAFLKGKDYIFKDMFPSSKTFSYPPSIIISKIAVDDTQVNEPVVAYTKKYIEEKLDGDYSFMIFYFNSKLIKNKTII